MAVILTFQDSENELQRLQVFKNKDNRCFISTGQTDSSYFEGWCTLDSDDLIILISELQSIKKSIDENE